MIANDSNNDCFHDKDRSGLFTDGTILLIEDDRAILDLTELVLLRDGYTVLKAETTNQALALYRDNQLVIDVVLTDLNLSGDSGLDLAEKLWQTNADLQFIFISGDPNGAKKVSSLKHHHVAYLAKPYRLKDLVPFIETTVRASA
ncbi:MAG: two-component system cell cycle sensor histidine kinase/response regulator CckA [Candidatus Azotimanducaceae bacterium]|jgi:two-component system cell cycle sensor histidine kinase/response regulator CckA